jgi:hypothetical protein
MTERALFDKIPNDLFALLTGKLKSVHIDLLFLLFDLYRNNSTEIEKELVISLFSEYLELNSDEYAYGTEGDFIKDVRERAHSYLLKFTQYGWVKQEQYTDYKYRVFIPEYASRILETLDRIEKGFRLEFTGTVLSIYQNLSGEEGNSYYAIQQAKENTYSLINGLRELNHNIKTYIENLIEMKDAKLILENIFNEYGEKILGTHYYRLKTSDHISKYRTKIIDKIRDIYSNEKNIKIQAELMKREDFSTSILEAENTIYEWLEFIENSFENIYDLLDEIDARNKKYHRAAITRIKMEINKTGNITSKINNILVHFAEILKENDGYKQKLYEGFLNTQIDLYSQTYLDENSVKRGTMKKPKLEPKPMEVRTIDENTKEQKKQAYKDELKKEITVSKINNYVFNVLEDRDELSLADFPFENKDDYIQLIFTLLHSSNNKANYKLVLNKDGERGLKVKKGMVPNMTVRRKERKS